MATTDIEESIFQRRLEYIKTLEGDAKEKALADLSRDYPGRMELASAELASAEGELSAAMDMPQTRVAGSSSNPYAVAVAPNALEYAAQGLRGYNAIQDRGRAKGELAALSEGKERGLGGLMESMAAQSSALRQPARDAMATTGFGSLGLTEEELEELKRRRMGGL